MLCRFFLPDICTKIKYKRYTQMHSGASPILSSCKYIFFVECSLCKVYAFEEVLSGSEWLEVGKRERILGWSGDVTKQVVRQMCWRQDRNDGTRMHPLSLKTSRHNYVHKLSVNRESNRCGCGFVVYQKAGRWGWGDLLQPIQQSPSRMIMGIEVTVTWLGIVCLSNLLLLTDLISCCLHCLPTRSSVVCL